MLQRIFINVESDEVIDSQILMIITPNDLGEIAVMN